MTAERWKRIENLFESALAIAPEERAAFLDRVCDGDTELRREVEAMIVAGRDFGGAIESAIAEEATDLADSGGALLGKRIGPWKLTGVLGYGGTGTVYLAARDDQAFHKHAAVKLVKRGMETAQVLKRFRRERQILARLDHPYIARLLDGGSTEDGAPYFIMEYVDGTSITEYCARHELRVADRLRLFLSVCSAVQFAHQNLVVHRDLKPGNIFITKDGTPKLLDFGLAKLTLPDLEDQTVTVMRMMTPDYASPEQVRGEPVTTATDVYSLGVVLYELLTGRRPFETKTTSWPELERTICHTEPDSPATIVADLRGDLENIVLKALRKEPVRRYNSVEQFAEDIRRHLAGLPVQARKDTLRYRTGKFVRRNRWPVAVGALATAGLMLATAIAVVQANRAQRQFEGARSMAMTLLIDVNEKFRVLPGSMEGRKLMVEKGLASLNLMSREAGNDAAILWDLARGYEKIASLQASPDPAEPNLFDFQNGLRNYQRALSLTETVERLRGRDKESLLLLARIHVALGGIHPNPQVADRHASQALRLAAVLPAGRRWEPDGPEMTDYIRDQAHLFVGIRLVDSDPPAALEHFRKTGPQFKDQYSAVALRNMGDLEGAMASLAVTERFQLDKTTTHTAEDILTRTVRWARAWALHLEALLRGQRDMNLADPAAAAAKCRKAIELLETNLKVDAADALAIGTKNQFLTTLGMLIADTDPAESVRTLSAVLASRMYPGPPWGWMKDARWGISYPLRKLGKTHEALQQAQQGVTEARPESIADAHRAVADALMDLGRKEAALEEYRAAVAAAEKRASSLPKNMVVRAALAWHYDALGRYFEIGGDWRSAKDWYAKAHALWRDWSKAGGVLNPFVIRSERRAAGLIAKCDAALVSVVRRN